MPPEMYALNRVSVSGFIICLNSSSIKKHTSVKIRNKVKQRRRVDYSDISPPSLAAIYGRAVTSPQRPCSFLLLHLCFSLPSISKETLVHYWKDCRSLDPRSYLATGQSRPVPAVGREHHHSTDIGDLSCSPKPRHQKVTRSTRVDRAQAHRGHLRRKANMSQRTPEPPSKRQAQSRQPKVIRRKLRQNGHRAQCFPLHVAATNVPTR